MAQITAALVKELRERTSAGMMDCKKALQETAGDVEAAIEHLRKTGQAKAEKKAGRAAAEGRIIIAQSSDNATVAMVEINCETDFVAKDENFVSFADEVAQLVVAKRPADVAALLALSMADGATVEETRQNLIAKIGENIQVRRFTIVASQTGVLNSYSHGGRIGVLVELQSNADDAAELAKDIAMHVAASRPLCISSEQIPEEVIAKEREIYSAQAKESGKPDNIVEKMVSGRIRKFMQENTLLGQPFVKDTETSVEKLLNQAKAQISRFERFELGEGVEKKADDFVAEVMAQARGE